MKITITFITVSCLLNVNKAFAIDFIESMNTVVRDIMQVKVPGSTAVDIAKDALLESYEGTKNVVKSVTKFSDLVINKTIFPYIPDMKAVLPRMEKLMTNFPIMPGTQWCGKGNIAFDIDSTGIARDTDLCCRAHDLCFDALPAGKTKHGLVNIGSFTRSHCNCDQQFYNCLKEVNTPSSIAIGVVYFSLLGPQCYQKSQPILQCSLRTFNRCEQYKLDATKDAVWQWFDNNIFK